MNVQLFRVHRETLEETLTDEYPLDLSALLFETLPDKQICFKFDKLKAIEILYFNISISTNEPILTPFMRNKLNPLMVNLVACKDVPYKTEPEYKPIFSYF